MWRIKAARCALRARVVLGAAFIASHMPVARRSYLSLFLSLAYITSHTLFRAGRLLP
jgi:hypothetical protein